MVSQQNPSLIFNSGHFFKVGIGPFKKDELSVPVIFIRHSYQTIPWGRSVHAGLLQVHWKRQLVYDERVCKQCDRDVQV